VKEQVLELKRQALVLKQQGDTNGALQLLGKARDLEFATANIDDLQDPTDLKKLAVVLKNKGDVEGAKQALLKAKQILSAGGDASTESQAPPPSQPTQAPPPLQDDNNNNEENDDDADDDHLNLEDVSDADDEDLKELQEEESSDIGSDDDIDIDNLNEPITFTIEEMVDLEMMMEFNSGGLPVPSMEDYDASILEQKKKALAYKQAGNTSQAIAVLKVVKRLQATKEGLSQTSEGLGLQIHDDDDQWLEELGYVDSEEVGNFLNPDTTLNLDDLDGMDPSMLQDALEMGMEIPSIEDIMTKSQEKKQIAIECKQRQDIEGAKVALVESKKLKLQAEKLQDMLNMINSKDDDGPSIDMHDLEALLDNNNSKAATTSKPKSSKPAPAAVPSAAAAPPPEKKKKTAAELKEEVLKLKAAKKMKEATEVFKLYKQTLIEESNAKEWNKCQEMIQHIQSEIDIATEEQRYYDFYSRFVDASLGQEQLQYWYKYQKQCQHIIHLLTVRKSSKIVSISRQSSTSMRVILTDDIVQFINKVNNNSSSDDSRLQVSVLHVNGLEENKPLQRILHKQEKERKNTAAATSKKGGGEKTTTTTLPSPPKPCIRVHINIHLPPNEHETDKSIDFTFEPSSNNSDDPDPGEVLDGSSNNESSSASSQKLQYKFDTTTGDDYVDLPRGDSKYAKSIIRRMERKRIQVSVFYVPPMQVKKPKGWFGRRGSSSSEDSGSNTEPVLLGKVYLELKDLLQQNCIVGDYPLATGSGRLAGGTIRLGFKTGVPFVNPSSLVGMAEESIMSQDEEDHMPLYEAMSFTIAKS